MAETSNISQIAEILANDLFSRFLWYETGGWNQNWACVRDDHVLPKRKKRKPASQKNVVDLSDEENEAAQPETSEVDVDADVYKITSHPSDVVFYYDEPYSMLRTYINTDLKSYKKGSINPSTVASAVQSLARSLECAEVSLEWREKFVHEEKSYRIVGLLFIYNHDGEYDLGFDDILSRVNQENLTIPKNSRIFILGPRDIRWLDNVRYDIVSLRGTERLPHEDKCSFFYPDLVRKKIVQSSAKAATLEILTGPWIILSYRAESMNPAGYVIYFRGLGKYAEEFLYLIDHLLHYQMVKPGVKISVRAFQADENAPAHFKRAVEEYIENCEGDSSDLAKQLHAIEWELIPQVRSQFSQVKIGMKNG